jgi:ketosteroid isomerase-like protein
VTLEVNPYGTMVRSGHNVAIAGAPRIASYAYDCRSAEWAPADKEEAVAEAALRQRVQDGVKAIRAKDIDAVMSLYASNVVSFDLGPPLRYAGADNKRRAWQEVFAAYPGPIAYEVHELNVTTHGDLAFVHSLNHVSGSLASGHTSDLWLRWTACFRRIDGVWLVVHDHVSVPADLEHGQAVLNLTP